MRIFYDCEDGKMFNKGALSCIHTYTVKNKAFYSRYRSCISHEEVYVDKLTTNCFGDPKNVFTSAPDCVLTHTVL